MSDLDKISSVFNAKIDTVKTKDDLQNIKTEFFGKNGSGKTNLMDAVYYLSFGRSAISNIDSDVIKHEKNNHT